MRLPFHRSAAIGLALCAMVLRALLPDGWMPAAAAGSSPFVICSVDGVHGGGKPPADPARESRHAPCAFAAAAHLAPPAIAPAGAFLPPRGQPIPLAWRNARLDSHERPRSHPPRAPPAFS